MSGDAVNNRPNNSHLNPINRHRAGVKNKEVVFHSFEEAIEARERDERFTHYMPIVRDIRSASEAEAEPISEIEERRRIELLVDTDVLRLDDNSFVTIRDPLYSFEDAFRDNEKLLEMFRAYEFASPTKIQSLMWPHLLSGSDCIAVSGQGSGKTLGFLLPAFLHLDAQRRQYEPFDQQPCPSVLLLTPTRDSANEIKHEVDKFAYNGYKSVCILDGNWEKVQIDESVNGMHILITTIGCLAMLAYQKAIDLSMISYVVFNRADKMLEESPFEIRLILADIRPDHIMVMTCNTWPQGIRQLACQHTKGAVLCVVGALQLAACWTVAQYVEFHNTPEAKKERLLDIIAFLDGNFGQHYKLIVFVAKKCTADDLSSDLCRVHISTVTIDSARNQPDRANSLKIFHEGKVRIMITTDLAARGIDIPGVTHVVNFDFPPEIADYVRRMGRTRRGGRIGEAISFLTMDDWCYASELINVMDKGNLKNEIPDFMFDMRKRYNIHLRTVASMRGRRPQRSRSRGGH